MHAVPKHSSLCILSTRLLPFNTHVHLDPPSYLRSNVVIKPNTPCIDRSGSRTGPSWSRKTRERLTAPSNLWRKSQVCSASSSQRGIFVATRPTLPALKRACRSALHTSMPRSTFPLAKDHILLHFQRKSAAAAAQRRNKMGFCTLFPISKIAFGTHFGCT